MNIFFHKLDKMTSSRTVSNQCIHFIFTQLTGSRRGARQMVFLVTDGRSNTNRHQTVPNAKKLKDDGVEIFVIAVGYFSGGIEEIVQVASLPVEDHVLRVRSYGDMIDVVKLVVQEINPGQYAIVEKIPPPC